MQIKLTALTGRFQHGRTIVTCVPRDADTNEQISHEIPLAQALMSYGDISNSDEVLRQIVSQFGFGA